MKKFRGRIPTLTVRKKHAIARQDSLEKHNSTQIKTKMNLKQTSRTVHNVLKKNSILKYVKLQPWPSLTNI